MKKVVLLLTVVAACGGDTTAPFNGLTGTYSSLALPGDPDWVVSWPSSSTETGCARIQSDRLTFNSASSVTENRSYVPLQEPFVVTLVTYTGTYNLIEGTNTIELEIDGGKDTATVGTYRNNPALVAHRRFADYTGCGSGGPYSMLYVNSPAPPPD